MIQLIDTALQLGSVSKYKRLICVYVYVFTCRSMPKAALVELNMATYTLVAIITVIRKFICKWL